MSEITMKTDTKGVQALARVDVKGDLLGIVQEIKI